MNVQPERGAPRVPYRFSRSISLFMTRLPNVLLKRVPPHLFTLVSHTHAQNRSNPCPSECCEKKSLLRRSTMSGMTVMLQRGIHRPRISSKEDIRAVPCDAEGVQAKQCDHRRSLAFKSCEREVLYRLIPTSPTP